jgi:hypothetical protein
MTVLLHRLLHKVQDIIRDQITGMVEAYRSTVVYQKSDNIKDNGSQYVEDIINGVERSKAPINH